LSLREVLPLHGLRHVRNTGNAATPWAPALQTKSDLREVERETLLRALVQAHWKVAGAQGAARALGIPPSTLASRMKALQIRRPK
jgi:transcriptional regulator with GAF, ATPase, and Fis domain